MLGRQVSLDAMAAVPGIDQLEGDPGRRAARAARAAPSSPRLRARGDELLDHFVDAARSGRVELDRDRVLARNEQAGRAPAVRGAGRSAPRPIAVRADRTRGRRADQRRRGGTCARASLHPPRAPRARAALPARGARGARARRGRRHRAGGPRTGQRAARDRPPRPTGSLGVSPQTKRLLELARAIAKSLGHRCPRRPSTCCSPRPPRSSTAPPRRCSPNAAPPPTRSATSSPA